MFTIGHPISLYYKQLKRLSMQMFCARSILWSIWTLNALLASRSSHCWQICWQWIVFQSQSYSLNSPIILPDWNKTYKIQKTFLLKKNRFHCTTSKTILAWTFEYKNSVNSLCIFEIFQDNNNCFRKKFNETVKCYKLYYTIINEIFKQR